MKRVGFETVRLLPESSSTGQELFGVIPLVGFEGLSFERLNCRLNEFGRLEVEGLPAVDAEVEVLRCCVFTPRTDDGRDLDIAVADVDVFAVESGVGRLHRLVTELGLIAGSVFRPVDATLSLLDLVALHPEFEQPACVRLPEVRRRDRLVDASLSGRPAEDLSESPVRDRFGFLEVAPQRHVVGVERWVSVGREPPRQIRHRDEEMDDSFAFLSVDVDGVSVVRLEDVADTEVLQFASTEPSLELQRDESFIASVRARLDHGDDLFFIEQEVTFGGCGVEVVRRPCRNPRQRRRRIVGDLAGIAADGPEVLSVVLVGVFVVVVPVDPADDILGCLAVLEGGDERVAADFFGHLDTTAEDVAMPVITDFRRDEIEVVGDAEQQVTSALGATPLAILEALPRRVDGVAWVASSHTRSNEPWLVKVWYESHSWLIPFCSQATTNTPETADYTGNSSGPRVTEAPYSGGASA